MAESRPDRHPPGGQVPADAARTSPSREVSHVVPLGTLSGAAIRIATTVESVVRANEGRADKTLARLLKERRDLAPPDHRFISRSVFALFRWKGWVDQLGVGLDRIEARLLYAWLLDSETVHPACRLWAQAIGRDASRLFPLGDAPSWTARGEGMKRLLDVRAFNADPWRLFPNWLREVLPLPPGGASPKLRYLEFLHALQRRPSIWVRAQRDDPQAVWSELKAAGLRPWVHRTLTASAKLDPESDIHHLPAFLRGDLEIQDLASQAVGLVCDPDPGERWWDACAGAGGKGLHLSALLRGKGLVVATDLNERALQETVRRARRSPFRNLTTRPWDGRGKHLPGKPASFDGVLVDAPCSAIGTWRRNPDARWTTGRDAVDRLAALQSQILDAAAQGVKPGGTLVYSVCTLTPAETSDVVRAFLAKHPEFQPDPFPNPLNGQATDGTLQVWPQDADCDAMFIARMVRTGT